MTTKTHEKDGVKYVEKDIAAYLTNRTSNVIYRALYSKVPGCITKTDLIEQLQEGFNARQIGLKTLEELENFVGLPLEIYRHPGMNFVKIKEGAAEPEPAEGDLEVIYIKHPSGRMTQAYYYKPKKLIFFEGMTEELFKELGFEFERKGE